MQPISNTFSCIFNSPLCQNKKPIPIALSVIFLLGGIFIILAAYQVLPAGANPISELSLGKLAIPPFAISVGLLIWGLLGGYAMQSNRCPNLSHRIALRPNEFKYTRQQVEQAITRVKKEFKKEVIGIEGSTKTMTTLEIFEGIDLHHHTSSFDIDEQCELLKRGLCFGICEELSVAVNVSENMRFTLKNINIENALYRQIKYNIQQKKAPSLAMNFTWGTRSFAEGKSKKELKPYWDAYWDAYKKKNQPGAEQYLRHSPKSGLPLTKDNFKNIFHHHKPKNPEGLLVQGRIDIEGQHVRGQSTPGHTFWFQYSVNGGTYHIIDTLDVSQGVFEFSDQESFIEGLYNQIGVFPNWDTFELNFKQPT